MSARKRKQLDVLPVFNAIQGGHDALINIKPKLAESRLPNPKTISDELYTVASLAESFSQKRPRANIDWSNLADVLDREGVNLWNISGQIRGSANDDANKTVFAALRLAAFRLIEAGLEQKLSIESKQSPAHLNYAHGAIQLYRISSHSRAAPGKQSRRGTVRAMDDPQGLHQQGKARAVVLYYSSRMEAAWREGNDGVAEFMLQKITGVFDSNWHRGSGNYIMTPENDQVFTSMAPRDRVSLASKLLEIGKSLLRAPADKRSSSGSGGAQDSVRWIQRAFSLVESVESADTLEISDLKNSILRSLARAYYFSSSHDPDNLSRAEASLNELIASVDASIDRRSPEYQQLRWMRIAILKRRRAAETLLAEAFQSIIDHMDFGSESCVTDLLQELRTLSQQHVLVTTVHQSTLRRALEAGENTGLPHVDRVVLSLLFHCLRDENHARATHDINSTYTWLEEEGGVTFIADDHNYDLDQYISAIASVEAMVKSPDFDNKMLLLAVQLAYESDLKTLLLSILEVLLANVDRQQNGEFELEVLTLRDIRVSNVIPGLRFAKKYQASGNITTVLKDVSWLWRTAFNTGVQGCSEWAHLEESVSDAFDIARELLEVYCQSVLTDVDPSLSAHIVDASFAAVAVKMFALRRQLSSEDATLAQLLDSICDDIKSCQARIGLVVEQNKLPNTEETQRAQSLVHTLRVFEVEVLCLRKDWAGLAITVEAAVRADSHAMGTFEAIADLLVRMSLSGSVSLPLLILCIIAILHASLDRMSLSVRKFSRWLRALCTILLSRNSPADRAKAIGYVEQAVAVLREHSDAGDEQDVNQFSRNLSRRGTSNIFDQVFPFDERQWLLGTAYNTGIECLHASLSDEAKRWFESSAMICRFVPDGEARAAKVSETYMQLLSRFGSGASSNVIVDPQ
ncbi:hypothetical protein NLI96_g6231 [Meripilus lineatus]|uniref:Uncharacterized protein n=1 Tax=Meripilus lineatus TaxID=2056292 RepID=A0AAD5YIB4_9APHY|nr:hypothetical protein NLI96_g6231 [Physisporinus lineatus]